MDNIVRNFAEIELTETELETVYGALGYDGFEDVMSMFCMLGTFAAISGTSYDITMSVVGGTFTKSLS